MDETLRTRAHAARRDLLAGRLRGSELRDALRAVPARERDAWVDTLLGLPEPPDDVPDLPPGSVPYLPCGVDVLLRMVEEAPVRPDDVFVDLGAGLGRAALLVHLMSGARAVGVELQPHLVQQARATAAQLGLLDAVSFLEGDASAGDLPEGSVYFVYASFNGPTLARVLARLERIAARRRIVLCAVDFEVHNRPWLRARNASSPELVLYDAGA